MFCFQTPLGVCPHCDDKERYRKKDKENDECKQCGKHQSLWDNAVMHGFRYRFIAIHLLTVTGKSFSASELQRQSGHKHYESIWTMLYKLRLITGKGDELYTLSDVIEWDEGFFSTETGEDGMDKPLKRKRMLLDISHDIKPEYLQNYLNEFCCQFNRRYFGENLFDRLLIAFISYKNQFR